VQYVGRADARPNFNVVFRAPSLDTHLGPAVQYWVVGAPSTGLIGRLDLFGNWWAIFPGIDAAHGAAHASDLIADLIGGTVEHQVLASDPWTARMLIADAFQDRRVFLVGESAHVNPPWGGHGFNTCVGDAVNIAWKIAAVENGWASPTLLDSYETERRGVIEQTVSTAQSNMRNLAGDLPTDESAIQAAKRSEFYSLGLVLGYTYAGSPVIEPSREAAMTTDVTLYTPTTQPGARLPHCWLRDGSSLYDHLGAGLTLLGPLAAYGPGVAVLVERAQARNIPLTLVESPPGYPWRHEFLLVRPDQHIAWRTDVPANIDIDVVVGCNQERVRSRPRTEIQ
jgi:FAD binding domain